MAFGVPWISWPEAPSRPRGSVEETRDDVSAGTSFRDHGQLWCPGILVRKQMGTNREVATQGHGVSLLVPDPCFIQLSSNHLQLSQPDNSFGLTPRFQPDNTPPVPAYISLPAL